MSSASPVVPHRRVLVLDSDEDRRHLLRLRLRARPDLMIAGEAADAVRAVELAQALWPDIVIADLGSVDSSPLALLRGIREAAPTAHVIAVTGYGRCDISVQALAHGAHQCLVQGFSAVQFWSAIEKALAG